MTKQGYVYILANKKNGTLYIGVTSNLIKRVWQHKHGIIKGFTYKYAVHHLVYYETYPSMNEAIWREKKLKDWRRLWKIKIIERQNVKWLDLYPEVTGEGKRCSSG